MEFDIKEMIGLEFNSVKKNEDNSELIFTSTNGDVYKFLHQQDCCESVLIEDIDGDLSDLENTKIVKADLVTNSDDTFGLIEYPESFTWTFYKFATTKGYVTIRWLGESNGYYSESVDHVLIKSEIVKEQKSEKLNEFLNSQFDF